MMRYLSLACICIACVASGAVLPQTQVLGDQAAHSNTELSSDAAWVPQLNSTCKLSCNGEDVQESGLHVLGEPKFCVGTFKVFCKSNITDGFGVFGFECEGKSTAIAGDKMISICEGALRKFSKVGFKTSGGNFVKAVKAYGCLGTSIGISSNSSGSSEQDQTYQRTDGFKAEDASVMESVLAGDNNTKEGRCDGLSGRFMAVKTCGKHGKRDHDDVKADKPMKGPHPMEPLPEEGHPDMPGARRSLSGHHDKHGNKKHGCKGKHHDADDLDEEKHHGDKLATKDVKHKGHLDDADMTFEDLEGKVSEHMQKAGLELLPHDVPSGAMEGPPSCKITCNGRPTWFGAFFPCFGKLEVDCGAGHELLATLAGSSLDVADGQADNSFSFHGSCKGFWSGALFKTCKGFSTAHVEFGDKTVWDFCAGKKAVRMGGKPGKGFYSGSWCKGKDLVVFEKDEESL